MLAEAGATDQEIADALDIGRSTFYALQQQHPEFLDAIKAAKQPADERVERTLYERATGYTYTEQQAVKVKAGQGKEEVVVVEVQRTVPPDITATIFWLKNRRKELWRDRHEVQHSVDGDLAALLYAARTRQGDKQTIIIGDPE